MFNRRTLFILGAGASAEFKFPQGGELTGRIARRVYARRDSVGSISGPGKLLYSQFVQGVGGSGGHFLKAASHIEHGVQLASSIDDFLDVHAADPHIQRIGKMTIVQSILSAERDSKLFFDRSNAYNRMSVNAFQDSWIVKFIRILARGLAASSRKEIFRNVAFIVFNYDRCLEHFLFHAVRQLYDLDEQEALEILETLDVVHPYGVAAPFRSIRGAGVDFGGSPVSQDDYFSLSKGVRTYSEQITDPDELKKIHDQMTAAQRIVFLGFAFHEQNMALLKPDDGINEAQIFSTAYGMSDSDVNQVKQQLIGLFSEKRQQILRISPGGIHVRSDLMCSQLFHFYSKSLPA